MAVIGWLSVSLVGAFAVAMLFKVPRRVAVVSLTLARRLTPAVLRKLGLGPRDYTVARGVRLAFEDLGPAYVKLGQMIASNATSVSEEVQQEFARCLDEVRPLPLDDVRKVLREEFGDGAEAKFGSIEREPLASASISQVHAATLKDGSPVVIKVQRPGIRVRIEDDLAVMHFWAGLAARLSPDLRRANPVAMVEDFQKTIREEMSFLLEAANIDAFNALCAEHGLLDRACAPRVEHSLTTERVLTMQRFFGVRIDDKEGVLARVQDPVDVLRTCSEVFWSCVFLGGFFHGDIHAGNIMVLDDGRLGYIDFGIFGRFSMAHRAALANWLGALGAGDGERLAGAIRDMGGVPDTVDWDEWVKDVTANFLPLRALTVDQPEMLQAFFPKLRAMSRKHDTHMPAEFMLILKQLTYFGRYVMMLSPKFNENLDPQSQQAFFKIFVKFNALRQDVKKSEPAAFASAS